MQCNNCGNKKAIRWRCGAHGECCDECGDLSSLFYPDVYFRKPYLDPNLGNPKRRWEKDGVMIVSKRHKAQLLKEQGLRELGSPIHGGRIFEKRSAANNMKAVGFDLEY